MPEWYYTKGEQRHGPVATDQLNQLAATGVVGASDLVWREGMTDWLPAGRADELTVPQPMAVQAVPPAAGGSLETATALLTDFKIPQTVMGALGVATLMTLLFYVWDNSYNVGAQRFAEALNWIGAILGIWLIIMAMRLKKAFTAATDSHKSVGSLLLTVGILSPLFALLYNIFDLSGRASLLYAMIVLPVGAYSLVKMREMQRGASGQIQPLP
jgi:hypothetical protein